MDWSFYPEGRSQITAETPLSDGFDFTGVSQPAFLVDGDVSTQFFMTRPSVFAQVMFDARNRPSIVGEGCFMVAPDLGTTTDPLAISMKDTVFGAVASGLKVSGTLFDSIRFDNVSSSDNSFAQCSAPLLVDKGIDTATGKRLLEIRDGTINAFVASAGMYTVASGDQTFLSSNVSGNTLNKITPAASSAEFYSGITNKALNTVFVANGPGIPNTNRQGVML
ncbi:MAG: hypothetical protein GY771_06865, partial [bacterium]|nr:hypothetical protein [bacterium]